MPRLLKILFYWKKNALLTWFECSRRRQSFWYLFIYLFIYLFRDYYAMASQSNLVKNLQPICKTQYERTFITIIKYVYLLISYEYLYSWLQSCPYSYIPGFTLLLYWQVLLFNNITFANIILIFWLLKLIVTFIIIIVMNF